MQGAPFGLAPSHWPFADAMTAEKWYCKQPESMPANQRALSLVHTFMKTLAPSSLRALITKQATGAASTPCRLGAPLLTPSA